MVNQPKLEILKTTKMGKPAIEIVVRNANAILRPLLDSIGIIPTPDISNRRGLICATPAELDTARAPLAKFFDKTGAYIGA